MNTHRILLTVLLFFPLQALFGQVTVEFEDSATGKRYFLTDGRKIIFELKKDNSAGDIRKGYLDRIIDSTLVIDGISYQINDFYMLGFTTPEKVAGTVLKACGTIFFIPAVFLVGYSAYWMLQKSNPESSIDPEIIIVPIFFTLSMGGWAGAGLCCRGVNFSLAQGLSHAISIYQKVYLKSFEIRIYRN